MNTVLDTSLSPTNTSQQASTSGAVGPSHLGAAQRAGEAKPKDSATSPEAGADGVKAAPPLSGAGAIVAPGALVQAQEKSDANKANSADSKKSEQNESSPSSASPNPTQLSAEEEAQVRALQQRDAEVRSHERAHKNAGGAITGPASFTYERGPDGKQYAVGGEVSISTGEAATPEATISKMETVVRAALAPASPSSQDLSVASAARRVIAEAQAEIQKERADKASQSNDNNATSPTGSDQKRAIAAYEEGNATAEAATGASAGLGGGETDIAGLKLVQQFAGVDLHA